MAENSTIEWTDATWNPVRGCTKITPGFKHCYAETFAERFRGVAGHPYEQGFDLRLVPEKLGHAVRASLRQGQSRLLLPGSQGQRLGEVIDRDRAVLFEQVVADE